MKVAISGIIDLLHNFRHSREIGNLEKTICKGACPLVTLRFLPTREGHSKG